MSYILEALRRADSERERGTVPTLHANPGPADLTEGGAGAPRSRLWAWVVGVIVLLGAGSAPWLLRGEREPPVLPAPVAPAPATMPTVMPASPPTAQALPPAPPPLAAATVPEALTRQPPPQPVAPVATQRPAPPAAPLPRTESPVADLPVPLASGLPEELRRQLPPLAAGGAMYSDAPANRMLIINGQLFHEGDKITPDLVLEQIKLRGAVLVFKGQRFRISY
nr:general secretion pathway protein GspB [uncultured Roseateles sp.]